MVLAEADQGSHMLKTSWHCLLSPHSGYLAVHVSKKSHISWVVLQKPAFIVHGCGWAYGVTSWDSSQIYLKWFEYVEFVGPVTWPVLSFSPQSEEIGQQHKTLTVLSWQCTYSIQELEYIITHIIRYPGNVKKQFIKTEFQPVKKNV